MSYTISVWLEKLISFLEEETTQMSYCYSEEEIGEMKENLATAKRLTGEQSVSTLEEYFKLVETIDTITDGEFEIHNCGRLIMYWSD